ncbi:hypothetical protein GFL38_34535 [Rhizobium leguminosarum bv. viciae]|uniref:hypothetical protein n=1 Tax=Rhizobium ruizarguesonis TaxID=2081791 RepID=UPI00143F322E|nr:hypothetical protein [Rhizobium ruizarguesonis]NKJ77279.1 hypothetical protein [Rhizobium leguminosarum bv. viciae]NKQ72196.1 hypothetical protein [Rhizobium ruizarguesonis]NKQ81588.1 hypothetical protein [Rhizobium ruizarguesonis]
MVRTAAILELAFLCIAPGARAEDAGSAFDFFHRLCLSVGPDFERTIAVAKVRGWSPLSTGVLTGLAPVDNPEAIEGWVVSDNGSPLPMIVGVSKHSVNGTLVHTCTVVAHGIDSMAFERSFFQTTDMEAFDQVRSPTHIHKIYRSILNDRRAFVTLTVPAEPDGTDNLIASSIAEAKLEN